MADAPPENPAEKPGVNASRDLFWSTPALGAHEVIVNSPKPVVSLAQLAAEEVGEGDGGMARRGCASTPTRHTCT